MVHSHLEHRPLAAGTVADAPPAWAVLVVKCCVIGMLLLPVATLLWAVVYTPTEDVDHGPLAFIGSIMLGLGMFVTAAYLTTSFPPVRSDDER